MKKAIAYTADIILGNTGEVISRAYQKELIRQYALDNGIDVVAWFEDELYEEEVLKRPGIQAMLTYDGAAEVFLLERVWALSRTMASLRDFFKALTARNLELETATYLWDCTSQMVRRQVTDAATDSGRMAKPMTVTAAASNAAPANPTAQGRPTMMKKAIAYTADITLGTTGEVISRAHQKELIKKHAAENGIEVVAWFEDARAGEDLLMRPGIQAVLAYDQPAESFLVERVWALSRTMATLKEFFEVLAATKMKLETASYLWDCTSQMVRRQQATAAAMPEFKPTAAQEVAGNAAIAEPAATKKPIMMKKAIAYTADILGAAGEAISRAHQQDRIEKYAAEHGIEVVAWFEDARAGEDLMTRPAVQAMLAYTGPADVFLVERVWALSRKIATLREFSKMLAAKKVKLETATYLWDGASQMVRRQITDVTAAQTPVSVPVAALGGPRKAAIAKPERFHFVGWAFDSEGESMEKARKNAA
ncbi:MAG TPA: recombinase family protein [Thermodesulfobacteriota bacterium]|nr:recombinase family protein [Deltaproteobacteria bacterium]HNR12576.1 recombinase family protein [Thermodesulfobacteriota bacterium]HNU72689.1 recombinase family protein [Thermodesulfobacteriota bacterium]